MKTMKLSLLILATLAATQAFADGDGLKPWSVKLGFNYIQPDVSSGDLSAPSLNGTKVNVTGGGGALLAASYAFTPAISAELNLGTPIRGTINGDGAIAGVGKLGTIDAYPPTMFVIYQFREPADSVRPFVGAGLTYAFFRNFQGSSTLNAITGGSPTNPTGMSIDSALGYSLKAGLTYNVNQNWFVEGAVGKTFLKTTGTLSTGQKIDIKLDPYSFNLALGYRF